MITVLGSAGFIGSHLVRKLEVRRANYFKPGRDENLSGKKLGDVIYCIGLTADFRTKPFETIEAHVCKLNALLRDCDFDSLLYLSSTRLYGTQCGTAKEDDALHFNPAEPSDLYNLSKAAGEAVALNCGRKTRVARLSNVYGSDFNSDNFLATVIKDALVSGKVSLHTAPDSSKDYVDIDDVVDGLLNIAVRGRERIYNLASGTNVANRTLLERISALTGCQVDVAPTAPKLTFPQINIDRMRNEFDFRPAQVLEDLSRLIELYRHERKQ